MMAAKGGEKERAVLKSHQLFGVRRNVTEGSSTTPQRQMVSLQSTIKLKANDGQAN